MSVANRERGGERERLVGSLSGSDAISRFYTIRGPQSSFGKLFEGWALEEL